MEKKGKDLRRVLLTISLIAILLIFSGLLVACDFFGGSNQIDENAKGGEKGTTINGGQGSDDPVLAQEEEMRLSLEDAVNGGLLILANKENALAKDYKPTDLTEIKYFAKDRSPNWRKMREEATNAFHSLAENAMKEGLEIVITTAYRSYDFQSELYYSYVKNKGQDWADKYSARPGTSEHQTGLATDCSAPSVGYQLTSLFADTKEGKWLADNCYKYGFVIRYPENKIAITGYNYEPWHLRYVGQTAAQIMKEQDWALEELLDFLEQ